MSLTCMTLLKNCHMKYKDDNFEKLYSNLHAKKPESDEIKEIQGELGIISLIWNFQMNQQYMII